MTSVATFQDVAKCYRDQVALDDVSFEVPAGSVFALLGENGAGKTTAIRILLGLESADRGHATLLGHVTVREKLDVRRQVGYVADKPVLYPWMTVDEIGWFASGFYDASFGSRYREWIHRFEVPANKKIKTLSRGMQAKVTLALSLAPDPDLLILDEPTSGLDPLVRREFLESMVDRAALGKTVLLASHQIAEVERVADWVLVLHQGKVALIERMEVLKSQFHCLRLALESSATAPGLDSGQIISLRSSGRQWWLLVRGARESLEAELARRGDLLDAQLASASLEDIYVGLIRPTPNQAPADLGTEALTS